MTKALDRKKIELVLSDVRRALLAGHPDTRAGRYNPNLGVDKTSLTSLKPKKSS